VLGEPPIQKVKWRSLGPEGFTKEGATEVINDQAIACLTIKALEAVNARAVGRALNNKAKINGDTLIA
jgi:hypothetical protein